MKKPNSLKTVDPLPRRSAPLATRTDLSAAATKDIAAAMNAILADVFALYLKTKNFHWHMSGPHFRDYHLLLDEHADQLFAMTDPIAERVRKLGRPTLKSIGHISATHLSRSTVRSAERARKLGGPTLKSIGQISRIQRVLDNDAEYVEPLDML